MNKAKEYFTNLIDPKLLVILLLIIVVVVATTVIFSKKVKGIKKYKINMYIYFFIIAFIYLIITFLGYSRLFLNDILYEFTFYQCASLLFGGLHCYLYHNVFNKFDEKGVGVEYFFVLLTMLYAIIPFLLIYSFFNGTSFNYIMSGHFIIFLIPTFLNDTFNRAMVIPPKVFLTWKFPENYEELAGVSDEEMRDLVVFTFLIERSNGDKKYNTYRAKGPTRLDFGRLFFNFVLDYNDRHPEDPIGVTDEEGELAQWVFFKQPKWYETTQYIDPKYTIYMNGIEENSVIFCARSEQMLDEQNEEKELDYEYK